MEAQRTSDPGWLLFGRDQQLGQFHEAFKSAAEGRGNVCLLVGEPGIGKTALCRRFALEVAQMGGTTLFGHCYEEGSLAFPYAAFTETIGAAIRTMDDETLRQNLGSIGPMMARIVPELRTRAVMDDSTGKESDRRDLLRAVTEFFHNAARRQPLVLVLEDLHWADQDTLDLLLYLSRNLQDARLLIVGTYRDVEVARTHPLAAALAELRRQGQTQRIRLRGLSLNDSQAMLSALTGENVNQASANAIYDQTEGNPLFIREIERYLAEQDIPLNGREERGMVLAHLSIPEGLRDVIGSRLTKLGPECNQVLAAASVLGREFDFETLTDAINLPEDGVLDALEAVIGAGIVEDARTNPGNLARYRFCHALFQETLYQELSAPRRGRLHQRIARSIEQRYESSLDRHASELADHFGRGAGPDDLAKAISYGRLAARYATSLFAYGEAQRLLERAIEVHEAYAPLDSALKCEMLLELGNVLIAAGDRPRILDDLAPRALALARSLEDDASSFEACRLALGVVVSSSDEGRTWLEAAEPYVNGEPERRIFLHRFRAVRAFHDGEFQLARDLLLEVLELARTRTDPTEFGLASILVRLAVLRDAEGRSLVEEYIARSAGSAPTSQRAHLYLEMIGVPLQWGERSKAEVMSADLATLARTTREYMADLMSTIVDAIFSMLDGNLHLALEGFTRAVIADRDPFSHILRARVAYWLGDQAVLQEELEYLETAPQLVNKYYSVLLLAFLGRGQEARERLASLAPALADQAQREQISKWFPAVVLEAASLIGDEASAREMAALIGNGEPALRHPIFVLLTRHVAKAEALGGRHEEARSTYLKAIAFCEGLRHRPELALSRLDLAELILAAFPSDGAQALDHLELAAAEFEEMNMTPHRERALALKTALSPAERLRRMTFPDGLSEREVDVLRLVAAGRTNQQIADQLFISLNTVLRHVSSIFNKTGCANRTEAANYAHSRGLA